MSERWKSLGLKPGFTVTSVLLLSGFFLLGEAGGQGSRRTGQGGLSSPQDSILGRSDFIQKPGGNLPLDAVFRDETGAPVAVGSLNRGLPAVLVFAYYDCPMLCTVVLNGLAQGLGGVSYQPGKHYRVVVVSIDPAEGPAQATAKKNAYLARIGRDSGAVAGWKFLTGSQESIVRLAAAVGFRYAYDEERGEYAHPAGAVVLTPQGRISRYLLGVEFEPRDLRLALVEASESRIGSAVDRLLLTCYQYDPRTGRYTPAINVVLRAAGLLTLSCLAGFIFIWLRREHRARRDEVERALRAAPAGKEAAPHG